MTGRIMLPTAQFNLQPTTGPVPAELELRLHLCGAERGVHRSFEKLPVLLFVGSCAFPPLSGNMWSGTINTNRHEQHGVPNGGGEFLA